MPKTWIKIHIEFLDNPKVMTLNLALRGVWFTALGVAERYDRDGLLPPADRFALMAHTDDETAEKAFAALAKKGLLDETPDGFRIHDWKEWQARKPSDEPEAIAARQAKWYETHKKKNGLTPPNALGDVEQNPNAPNANKSKSEIKREKREENPPVSLRSTSPRGSRIPAAWPIAADLDEMDAYGASLGIRAEDVASHISEFHDYWGQATKNATSLDWVKRWRVRFGQDVREGKVGARPRAPTNGNHPVTFPEQRLKNMITEGDAFVAMARAEEQRNGVRALPNGNGPAGPRLQPGEQPRKAHDLLAKVERRDG